MLKQAIPAILASAFTFTPAVAADNNVAAGMGHDLSQHLCTTCHLIEPGQVNPPDHVGGPTFQSVADRPDVTVAYLRKHLKTTTAGGVIPLSMPNPQLTDDELVKIVAYITSLHHPK